MSPGLIYLFLIGPALLSWYAQKRVREAFKHYETRRASSGLSGLEAARRLLAHHQLGAVAVEQTPGHLTDHYDPTSRTLRLSEGVADGRSITSLGVVAHEVGHAAQDAEGFRLMRVRVSMGSRLAAISQWSSLVFIGGMLFGMPIFMGLGALMLAGMLLFSLVTLPLERDASNRALASLTETRLVAGEEERASVRSVLRAAAFTYAAKLGRQLATFLFFVVIVLAARGV